MSATGKEGEANRSGNPTPSSVNAGGAAPGGSILRKNAPGSRGDVAWKHGVSVDGDARKIQCKYCRKVITGGVYRLKHHLAGTQKDVGACTSVTEEVKKEMWEILTSLHDKSVKKSNSYNVNSDVDDGEKRKGIEAETENTAKGNIFKRKAASSQVTLNNIFKKNLREVACQDIASFFYNNAIPFNVARSEEFHTMLDSVARHGLGLKPPSYHEIRVKYLKHHVNLTTEAIEKHRAEWKKMGCTIMTDGWTDRRRRTILNLLVNSPMGTVFLKSINASDISKTADKLFKMMDDIVEEVCEENIVHIVTDNAANYKAAGEMLMEKRKRLYWTPCAAHCIDLMLEDLEKKLRIHQETISRGKKVTTYIYSRTYLISLLQNFTQGKDLVRPAITRFATSYLTLGCLQEHKGALVRMFTSNEWKSSRFAKTKDGKFIEEVIMDKDFWKGVVVCLKGTYPLIKVLRLVDSDEKLAMGYIYEEMDRAKENIAKAFNDNKKRWDSQLHRPLHAAGYYLNPFLHYSSDFKADFEVKRGLYDCIQRVVASDEEMTKIDLQIEDFKAKKKYFGSKAALLSLQNQTKTPSQWWECYGDEHPELQKFAIRILSLTCSSSGCERNWSAFELVHTKRRNRLKQKTMNDVVYVMANSKLAKKKKARKAMEFSVDDLPSDDEWIMDEGDADNLDMEIEMNTPNEGLGHDGNDGAAAATTSSVEIPPIEFDVDLDVDVDGVEDDYYNQNLKDLLEC